MLEIDYVDSYPVIPRDETVADMREHSAQFQSALSMLDRMYDDPNLDVADRESERGSSSGSAVRMASMVLDESLGESNAVPWLR